MTAPGCALGDRELASYLQRYAGSIMDMKMQGSRSGKTLGIGIGELFPSASAPLDRS